MHPTDEALMQAIIDRRDAQAFAALYDRWSARMYRYFLRMMNRQAAKAADLTQDLFLKIIEKPYLFDPSRRFSTWLYTLAANQCKNEFRRKKLIEQVENYPETIGNDAAVHLPESIDKKLLEQHLQWAIHLLEEPQRQCFVLRWQEDLSIKEISEIVDCPEGTVKSRLYYALRQVSAAVREVFVE